MNRLCQSRGLQTAGILAVASFLLLLRSSHHWAQVLLLVATSCSGTAMSHLLFNSSESCRPCPAVRYGVSPSAFPSLPLLKETFTHTCCQGGADSLSRSVVTVYVWASLSWQCPSLVSFVALNSPLCLTAAPPPPTLCVRLPLSAVLCNLIDLWGKCWCADRSRAEIGRVALCLRTPLYL